MGQVRGLGCTRLKGHSAWGSVCADTAEPYGKRILGYDNAHAVKPPKKFKYAGTKLPYDHKHRHVSDKGVSYEFKDAHQLLSDFFVEVDRVLKEARKS